MRTRTRKRGVDGLLAYRSVVPPSFRTQVGSFTYSFPRSKEYPSIVKRGYKEALVGVDVKPGDMPDITLKRDRLGYWSPEFEKSLADSLASLVYNQINERIWLARNPGVISFLETDTAESMTDVVGSGFTSSQGRNFIVNPCTSEKRKFEFPTSMSNGWTKEVSVVNGGYSDTSITYRVIINLIPKGFTVGLPATIADQIKADARGLYVTNGDSTFQTAFARVQEGEAEALTMLAESKKTLSYVTSRLRNMAEILVKAKRAVTKLDAKAAADLWLEARYAIRPIMYDVENTIRAINKDSLATSQTFRASDVENDSFERTYTLTAGDTVYKTDVSYQLMERHSAGVYTRLRFDLPTVHTFGLTNFAQTAWELIPFSFVIDWFVNVAGFIASINPNPVYSIENGFLATKRIILANGTLTVTRGEESVTRHFVYQINTYSRDAAISPSFFNLDLNLSVPKVVDLFALAKKLL